MAGEFEQSLAKVGVFNMTEENYNEHIAFINTLDDKKEQFEAEMRRRQTAALERMLEIDAARLMIEADAAGATFKGSFMRALFPRSCG
ncbi:MAG: hypothetical protein DU429_01860 [Candidatus Tokpelaia sp.]|uniref:hypothetical protein n=1 Tax=Candidatus Tokpelaia sp. TaxID=2233777 RepID=UPI00123C16A6|nr:hypothetical protein [Candidatus Tokpelaia sp.]KAA6205639.1 MAG: hypothetical protein DU430_03575 [Candidatus Tokpelaia sp.]KAA6207254.1 MAG: hypothetical protein DU429_01860 [Candidatus Tokpelaia sp.]KAA6405221.1 hypothetical protein DPQ22_06775 [Candidatus Tokpelaia sp.]